MFLKILQIFILDPYGRSYNLPQDDSFCHQINQPLQGMTALPDIFYHFFLEFSHPTIIVPLLLLVYIRAGHEIFYDTACLLFISPIVNVALKITFQIPLTFKEGFAFPSGHMQFATVLYGWLAFRSRNIIYQIIASALIGAIGASLVHFGYHNFFDIGGGIFFGWLLIIIYYSIKIKTPKILPWFMWLGSSALMIYIYKNYKVEHVTWMAYYGLTGFILLKLFYKSYFARKTGAKF
jgi:membrane-associated phospholipid phosphatase